MQAVPAVEHEDLERGDAELLDQRRDLTDVLLRHRREVEGVVDVGAALGGGQHLREELPVGPALVQVVLPGAHVGEPGGDAALGAGPALGLRILAQRVVDAPVLVGVDHAGEGHAAPAVHDHVRVLRGDVPLDPDELPVDDAEVERLAVLGTGDVRSDDRHVLDKGVEAGHAVPSSEVMAACPGADAPWLAATWSAAR